MKRFKNVLVFVTGESKEETALRRAQLLAEHNNAALTLVTVVDELPVNAMPEDWDPQEVVRQELAQWLEQLAAPVRDQGIGVSTRVLSGTPALAITREVVRHGHDLVMKSALGKDDDRQRLFGTVAHRLMRVCPCPVWVVQPSYDQSHRAVLAAIDPRRDDHESRGLNQKILELAVSLAESEAKELDVVHAWDAFADLALIPDIAVEDVESVERTVQEESRQKLTECLAPWSSAISEDHVYFVRGSAEAAICGLVVEQDVDIIVMGTAAPSGRAGFLIGNTAERVLNQVTCSVLAVKPDGFISPVDP